MHLGILPECLSVHHVLVRSTCGDQKGVLCPLEVKAAPTWWLIAGIKPGFLEVQPVLLTAGPSL